MSTGHVWSAGERCRERIPDHRRQAVDEQLPAHEANWLPAPAVGKFEVTLRMYGPSQSVLDDTYAYPPIERVS